MPLSFGSDVGELRVLDPLAVRGPVTEYVAYDPHGVQLVRLALLDPAAELPVQLRFAFEAHLLRNTQSPRLEPWVTGGTHDGCLFRAVRLERGRTLEAVLREHERLSTRLTATVMRGVLEALDDLHGERLVGLGLTPDEVVILADGSVQARGLATLRPLEGGGDGSVPLVPLPAEADPGDARADEAMDLYRAGLLGWRLLGGEAPQPDEPPEDWPEALQAVLYRCLASDPRVRYAGAGEALRAMEEHLAAIR